MQTPEGPQRERLTLGYNRLMERARDLLTHAKGDALPRLKQVLEQARNKAVELEELSIEEAERVGEYLNRDLQDAAHYLSYTGKSLGDWLNIDLELAEQRLMDVFSNMVDHTRAELEQLAERARRVEEIHTGEVVGPGTLKCGNCGGAIHFREAGHVPPCPKCHSTSFARDTR